MWSCRVLLLLLAPLLAAADVATDARLDAAGLARRHGYPLEEHAVRTEDGYVLTAHRIPRAGGVPVLVMHGLACSSADFLVLGPGAALAYVLADAGYDVWLGNARGNRYSRRHVALDPDDESLDFWRFSWDEIGERDVSALLDHVTAVTGQWRAHYVGYSQGTTALLVLLALRPHYNDRVLSFQALAPAAYSEYHGDSLKDRLVEYEHVMDLLAFRYGLVEVMPHSEPRGALALRLCSDGAALQALCARALLGPDTAYFNKTLLPVFLGHNPAGAAVRQILHYSQVQRFGRFARYNFDPLTNLARYGSVRPPEYDVSRVRVPTRLHYGLGDTSSLPANVRLLARRLGAAAELRPVPRASFGHFDFIWGADARQQVYDDVVAGLRARDPRSLPGTHDT